MSDKESDLAWFRFFGRRWLHGTIAMRPDDRGLFVGVICLIVEAGGPVVDDDNAIAKRLGVDVRTWRASRQRLVDAGKLTACVQKDNCDRDKKSTVYLGNIKAESEAIHQRKRLETGRDRAAIRWGKGLKKNKTGDAGAYADDDAKSMRREEKRINPLPLSADDGLPCSPVASKPPSAVASSTATSEASAKWEWQIQNAVDGLTGGFMPPSVTPEHVAEALRRGLVTPEQARAKGFDPDPKPCLPPEPADAHPQEPAPNIVTLPSLRKMQAETEQDIQEHDERLANWARVMEGQGYSLDKAN